MPLSQHLHVHLGEGWLPVVEPYNSNPVRGPRGSHPEATQMQNGDSEW